MKEKKQLKATTHKKGGKLVAIASTENKDRAGDSLMLKDWDLSRFKENPVLQAGHDYRPEFTIGVAKNIKFENKTLTFEPEFHEITQLARDIKKMYEEGVLKAWSVGFIPKSFTDSEKNELMEVSAVAVPANADCLTMAKSYGEKEATKVDSWVKEKTAEDIVEEKQSEEVTETINQEVTEKENRKKKYEKFDEVDNILYAFYNVYMQKDMEVEKFDELLTEAIGLLGNLLGSTEKSYKSKSLKNFDGSFAEVMMKEVEEAKEEIKEETEKEEVVVDENKEEEKVEVVDEKSISEDVVSKIVEEVSKKFAEKIEEINLKAKEEEKTKVALVTNDKKNTQEKATVENNKGRNLKGTKKSKTLSVEEFTLLTLKKINGLTSNVMLVNKNAKK